MNLESKKVGIFFTIGSLAEKKNWDWYLAFFCCVYVFIIAFPPYYDLKICELLEHQIVNPFVRLPEKYLYSTHEQKHQFRLTVPLLGNLLHIKGYTILVLQYISAFLLFLFCYRLSYKITADKITSTLCTFATANIYVGTTGVYDVFWHFDSIAISLLLLAMYTKSNYLMALFLIAAAFTDERAFIASSLVYVYKVLENKKANIQIKDLFAHAPLIILLSWLTYFLFRLYLVHYQDFYTGMMDIGISTIRNNYNMFPLNVLFVFEGVWLLIALGIYKSKNDFIFVAISSIAVIIIIVVALLVMDVSRSTAYLYPLLFIGLYKCSIHYKRYALRKMMLIATIVSIIVPTQEFFNYTVYGMGPIFPKIIKLIN